MSNLKKFRDLAKRERIKDYKKKDYKVTLLLRVLGPHATEPTAAAGTRVAAAAKGRTSEPRIIEEGTAAKLLWLSASIG